MTYIVIWNVCGEDTHGPVPVDAQSIHSLHWNHTKGRKDHQWELLSINESIRMVQTSSMIYI